MLGLQDDVVIAFQAMVAIVAIEARKSTKKWREGTLVAKPSELSSMKQNTTQTHVGMSADHSWKAGGGLGGGALVAHAHFLCKLDVSVYSSVLLLDAAVPVEPRLRRVSV